MTGDVRRVKMIATQDSWALRMIDGASVGLPTSLMILRVGFAAADLLPGQAWAALAKVAISLRRDVARPQTHQRAAFCRRVTAPMRTLRFNFLTSGESTVGLRHDGA